MNKGIDPNAKDHERHRRNWQRLSTLIESGEFVGPPGADGVDGVDGSDGAPGAAGAPGSAGATGATGATGPAGPTGATGASGTDGANRMIIQVYGPEVPLIVQTGAAYIPIPAFLNGLNLKAVAIFVPFSGTTGLTTVQIVRGRVGVDANMLSTAVSIDSNEHGSSTAVTPAVIDTGNDDLATNDQIRIDVTTVSTTAPFGLVVTLEFGP